MALPCFHIHTYIVLQLTLFGNTRCPLLTQPRYTRKMPSIYRRSEITIHNVSQFTAHILKCTRGDTEHKTKYTERQRLNYRSTVDCTVSCARSYDRYSMGFSSHCSQVKGSEDHIHLAPSPCIAAHEQIQIHATPNAASGSHKHLVLLGAALRLRAAVVTAARITGRCSFYAAR